MELIRLCDYSFTYPGAAQKALDNIDLKIEEGSVTLICGPSGCGKTTLLRQLIPQIAPYGKCEGTIIYDGRDLSEYSDKELAAKIGYVSQNPSNQIITDKVWHELAFGLENLGMINHVMERRIAEICEFFGMQKWLYEDVSTLSGGQMQLVHLAAVMAMEPKVVLLDEPTAYLDPLSARSFLDMIRRLNTELGTTTVIVEHHLEEVYGMADYAIVMDSGRVLSAGTPYEVASALKYKGGLPSALLIARAVDPLYSKPPLTVSDGIRWMTSYMDEHKDSDIGTEYSEDFDVHKTEDDIIQSDADKTEVIKLTDVSFAYDDGKRVLHDCNLSVMQGEIYALLGGNGAGKSTLLNVLVGALDRSYGSMYIFGDKVTKHVPLGFGKMVLLPQDPMALFTEITVEEELMEALTGLDISVSDKRDRVDRMLNEMSLSELRKSHPYDLSSGQMQTLAICKLLLLEPKIILMDEPTKGLDYDRKEELGKIIIDLSDKGITILLVSHDIEFAARYAKRCAIMHDGRVVAPLATREFFSGNKFFTTAANRIARRFFSDVILYEEVIERCLNLK